MAAKPIVGTNDKDTLNGTSGNDIIYALAGNDVVSTGSGNDAVDAGAGNDVIHGGSGQNTLFGGTGNDVINAGTGSNTVYGGSGNDTIVLSGSAVNVAYGDGYDTFKLIGSKVIPTDPVAAPGNDNISGSGGNDTLYGDNGNNPGGSGAGGNDVIHGGGGGDVVYGEGGNDQLFGDGGNDQLFGGAGGDTLTGGTGADSLTGGGGDDFFRFDVSDSLAASSDVVIDFISGQDKIDLDLILGMGTDLLWGGNTPTAMGVWFVQSGGNTYVYADTDGTPAAPELVVRLNGLHDLQIGDFLGVNRAPTLTGALATLDPGTEDSDYTIYASDLLLGYSDADGDLLSVSGLTADNGTLVDNGNGTWTFTPAADFSGEVVLNYDVFDGVGGVTAATQSFDVAAVADQPNLSVENATGTSGDPISLVIDADLTDTDGSETLSATISGVPDGWTLSAGTLLDPETGTYVLSSSELAGLTVTPSEGAPPGEYALTVTATATEDGNDDTSSNSATLSVTVLPPEGVALTSGTTIDGYIAGATVFADADDDSELDDGEVRATTDANGNFTLVGADPNASLVMFGGTDVSTGLAFEGVLRAPAGSTVVTPLTTLMAELIDSGAAADPTEAQDLVKVAFGLSATIDLASFDPVQETIAGTAGAAEILAAGIQVQNAIVQVTALLGADGAGATDEAAADAAVASLAGLIVTAAGGTVDLAIDTTVEDLIADSAGNVTIALSAELISAAADVLSAANGSIDDAVAAGGGGDTTALLTDIAQVASVAQGDAVAIDLGEAGDLDDPGTIVADYTGTSLENQINTAEVGDVDGGVTGTLGNDTLTGTAGNDAVDGLAGNDLLIGLGGNDTLYGSVGHDSLRGGPGDDVLNGGILADFYTVAGFTDSDVADYSTAAGPVNVNLATGVVSDDGDGGTDSLSGVEGVIGSAGADTITGSAAFFEYYIGGAGNDTIDGGLGSDRALYSAASGPISVTLGSMIPGAPTSNGLVTGDLSVGIDTLIGVEQIRGTNYADTYFASGFLSASQPGPFSSPFNEFEGMGGNDLITGNGATRVSYQNADEAVTVSLVSATPGVGGSSGTAVGGASVDTDTFTGISSVRGSRYGDAISGGTATSAQQFEGRGGNDTINGGSGFDTAGYAFDGPIGTGLTINLAAGTVIGDPFYTGTDTLLSVEAIQGSILADYYDATGYGLPGATNIGNNGTFNEFEGMAGDDTIITNGNTRISYISAREGVTVTLTPAGGTAVGGASVGTDTITGVVTQVRGSNFDDVLTGYDNGLVSNQVYEGRGGNDTFNGGGGADEVTYANDVTQAGINVQMAFFGPSSGRVVGDAAIGTDTLNGIIVVRGTNFADIYVATGFISGVASGVGSGVGFNEFEGRDGNDLITGNGETRLSFINATSGVSVDLAAGTASGTSTGSDTITGGVYSIRGSNFNDTLVGSTADEFFDGRGGNDSIDGGAGFDRALFDAANSSGTFTVSSLGVITAVAGNQGNDTLTAIDFIRATNFSDTYDGSAFAGAMRFDGLNGDDTMTGGAGNDTLNGGGGIDLVDYSASTGPVTVNLAAGTASDGLGLGGTDSLSQIEQVTGSAFADTIMGNTQANRLEGGGGNDTLTGGGGNDAFYGEGGDDSLVGGSVNDYLDGGDGNDTLLGGPGIDTLDGGNHNDYLDAGGGGGTVSGGAGDDTLLGAGGNDTLDGGTDIDEVSYANAPAGVSGDIAVGASNDGLGGTDEFLSIENLRGSPYADALAGNFQNNLLLGGDGNDTITGGDGNDTLIGGIGADIINADGTGIDTIVFHNIAEAGDTINSFNTGVGGDVLKISDLLDVSTDYADGAGGKVLADYVRVDLSGSDGLLQIDFDGAAGGPTWQTLATITGGSSLTLDSLLLNGNIAVV